mgnify:FL=1
MNHDDAQTQIQNIRTAYKEKVLSDAQSRADEKDFLGAEAILMNSADILGDDKDIQAKLEEIKEQSSTTTWKRCSAPPNARG